MKTRQGRKRADDILLTPARPMNIAGVATCYMPVGCKSTFGALAAQESIGVALACGVTNEAAAKPAGVGESTVYRRLRDHQFCRIVHRARADIAERIAGIQTAASTVTVRTLLDLQKPNYPPAVV